MTQSITTLGEFLQAGNANYQVFDLGRCLTELDKAQFDAIERQQQPYPYPIRRHAQLAVLFRHQQQADNDYLWFIQLPLDERGLLNVAARDHYLEFVVNALGNEITGALTDEQEEQLKQNPYLFTPNETQRAALHARINVSRHGEPSIYFEDAAQFLLQPTGEWQKLGMQGIHDCAARLNQLPELTEAIAQHFANYPAPVRQQLAAALEHQTVPARLRDALVTIAADSDADELRNDALRALASCSQHGSVAKYVKQALRETKHLDANGLTIVAARLWPTLNDSDTLIAYLSAITPLSQALFDALFQDIISLPGIRPQVLALLAQGQLSEDTMQALNRLTNQAQG